MLHRISLRTHYATPPEQYIRISYSSWSVCAPLFAVARADDRDILVRGGGKVAVRVRRGKDVVLEARRDLHSFFQSLTPEHTPQGKSSFTCQGITAAGNYSLCMHQYDILG